jgi:hypothetical protein
MAPVTVVATEAEFIDAVKCEATHILVEQHLDLTGWRVDLANSSLLALTAAVKTLQVCNTASSL